MENMKKLNKIIIHNKNIDIHKTASNPIRGTRVKKLVLKRYPVLSFGLNVQCTVCTLYTLCIHVLDWLVEETECTVCTLYTVHSTYMF